MIQNKIPASMDFFSDSIRLVGVKENVEVYQNAQQNTITAGQCAHFYIGNNDADLADFRDSTLRFAVNGIPGGGTYSALPDGGIAGLINKCRLLLGSTLLHECISFNLLMSQWCLSQGILDYQNTLNVLMQTNATLAQRTTNFANPNYIYMIPLGKIISLFDMVLPLNLFKGQQLHLEVWFENPQNCLSSDGTPTYQILNPQLHFRQLIVTDTYKNMLQEKLSKSNIQIPYLNYSNYVTVMPTGVTKQQNSLPFKFSRYVGHYCISRDQANITNYAYQTKFTNFYLYTQFINAKTKLNNKYYPADAINGTTENFLSIYELIDKTFNDDTVISSNYPQYFSLSQAICQYPKNLTNDDQQIQGMDISTSSSSVVHEITTSGAPLTLQQDYFPVYFSMISIDAKGGVTYLE